MLSRRAVTGLVLVGSLLVGEAAGAAQAQQRRNFCGVVRVRTRACLVVPGGIADNAVFDITSAKPRPRRGAMISGSGFERGFSNCIRADRRLSQVTWRRVTVCPQAR